MLPPSGLKQDCRYLKPRTGSTVGRHSLSGFNTNPVCTKYMFTAPSRGTKVNSKKKHWFSTTGFRILLNSPSLKIRLYSLLAKLSFQYCHVILCSANPHCFFSQQSISTLIIQTLKVTLHTRADVNKEQSNFK